MGICLLYVLQSSCAKPDVEADTCEIQQKQDSNTNKMKMLMTENIRSNEKVGVMQENASDGMIMIPLVRFCFTC